VATDVEDWQKVVTVVPSFVPGTDVPDWETVVVGPGGGSVGGYASLTGPGETATPGDLDQEGGFTVHDVNGDGIFLEAGSNGTGSGGLYLANNSTAGGNTQLIDQADGIVIAASGPAGSVGVQVQGADAPLTLDNQGTGAASYIGLTAAAGAALTLQEFFTLLLTAVPVYPNNGAAVAGGLLSGDLYRTGANPDFLAIVH
jgi:hypothetical protein